MNTDFSLAQRQFVSEVQRLKRERSLSNEEAILTVASAITAQASANVDQQSVRRSFNLLTVNADAGVGSLEDRNQIARMKKHGILKFHHARMHTHIILSHFDTRAFDYYEVTSTTDFAFRRCMLSLEIMRPVVEMIWLNCPTSNDDVNQRPHVFSVCRFGVWLARKVEQGLAHWKTDACCPMCWSMILPNVRSRASLSH